MKKIILAALLFVSVSSLAQPITDTNQLRSFINSAIVTNNTRAITATIVNRAFNGVLNCYAPIFQRFVDTLYFTGNTMYWRQRGVTYSRPVGAGVPLNRVLTINGVSYDLSADRTWTIASSSSWGSISGTLSSQTDLQSALNAKANLSHSHTLSNISNFPSVSGMSGRVLTTDGNVVTWGVVPSHTHLLNNISNFPSVSGQGGKFLTTDGNVVTWGTPAGGVSALTAIGSSPNANGASISGSTLTLQPASAAFGGVLSNGTQSISGQKTFTSATFIGSSLRLDGTAGYGSINEYTTNSLLLAGSLVGFGSPIQFNGPGYGRGRGEMTANGQVIFSDVNQNNTVRANSTFTVVSTSRGSSPIPVLNQSQRLAMTLSTQDIGLHVYQSDGTEGVWVYKSTGWQFAY